MCFYPFKCTRSESTGKRLSRKYKLYSTSLVRLSHPLKCVTRTREVLNRFRCPNIVAAESPCLKKTRIVFALEIHTVLAYFLETRIDLLHKIGLVHIDKSTTSRIIIFLKKGVFLEFPNSAKPIPATYSVLSWFYQWSINF